MLLSVLWLCHLYAKNTIHCFSLSCIGEGNGNPLQCSCLENPRDGRAWWAAVYGVAQSWTRLKRLSISSSSICWGFTWCHALFSVLCMFLTQFVLCLWKTVSAIEWCIDSVCKSRQSVLKPVPHCFLYE